MFLDCCPGPIFNYNTKLNCNLAAFASGPATICLPKTMDISLAYTGTPTGNPVVFPGAFSRTAIPSYAGTPPTIVFSTTETGSSFVIGTIIALYTITLHNGYNLHLNFTLSAQDPNSQTGSGADSLNGSWTLKKNGTTTNSDSFSFGEMNPCPNTGYSRTVDVLTLGVASDVFTLAVSLAADHAGLPGNQQMIQAALAINTFLVN